MALKEQTGFEKLINIFEPTVGFWGNFLLKLFYLLSLFKVALLHRIFFKISLWAASMTLKFLKLQIFQ
jgi:hypothetical protein